MARPCRIEYDAIFIHDVAAKVNHQVTSTYSNEHSPAWDPDGRYLYFVSNRATNPILGQVDWDNVEARNEMLYMLLLRDDVENPLQDRAGLPPQDGKDGKDKQKDAKKDTKKDAKKDAKKDTKKDDKDDAPADEPPTPIAIDFAGLADRYVELPVPVGNYGGLAATSSHLFFVQNPLKGMAEQPALFEEGGPEAVLMSFDLEDREAKPFVEGISGYDLQAKAGKIAVMKAAARSTCWTPGAPPGDDLAKSRSRRRQPGDRARPARGVGADLLRGLAAACATSTGTPDGRRRLERAMRDQYATLLPRLATAG